MNMYVEKENSFCILFSTNNVLEYIHKVSEPNVSIIISMFLHFSALEKNNFNDP